MSKKKRHKKQKRRGNMGQGQRSGLPVFAAAAVLVVFIGAVLAIRVAVSNDQEVTAVTQESEVPETLEAGEEESDPDAGAVPATGLQSTGEGEAVDAEPENEGRQTEVVAAEVAEMDDEEDPQNEMQSGSGAEVTIDEVTAAAEGVNEVEAAGIGIDVAKYQGTVDWQKVKEAGVEFAMIRVGYRTQKTGIIYEDPCARYNLQQAQAAGIKLGAYFFSTAITEQEAQEEAAWVTSFISQYKITYPVAYNCEGFQSADSRQYGLDNAVRTGLARVFLEYVQNSGYTPMFYASRNEMEGSRYWDMQALSDMKIWVSQYPEKPFPETQKSSYSGKHHMWQYTSRGSVAGISGNVDVNVAYFGYSQEAEAKNPNAPELVAANPEVGINFTEVEETVTAKMETNLRTIPSTADAGTISAKLKNGETATRTGVGHNGWSRVIYNGQTLYAVSSYLTADLNYQAAKTPTAENPEAAVAFSEVTEQVTAKIETNLRTVPSTASPDTVAGLLKNGEIAVRTGIADNGWSRLTYNGITLYAVSSYLVIVE